ncbi:programmed cell death protein 6-like isoform X2 [Paramacrobiotus metropolitanus]|uniref:programmed cell death protein 6-like isoform X2 n=1 Tax=Paramacrobiotus metropolitanus TaxID=2943436 RepID=UPI00244655C3|nr:programmed cell death protein 6-like isoform X2 [Paramacrobiotus metropolitanus]
MPTISGATNPSLSATNPGSPTMNPYNPSPYNPAAVGGLAPSYPPGQGSAYAAAGVHGHGYGTAPPPAGYGAGYPPQAGFGAPPQNPSQPPPGIPHDLWQWFQAVDTDRSGRINATELKAALLNGNYSTFNDGTCRLMIKLFDRDNSGTIDIHEFAALWKYIGDWRACFDRFDQDRSGNINTSELNQALTSFGYRLSPQFCHTLVRVYASRRPGTTQGDNINFDDFIEACVTIKNLTDTFRRYDQHQQGMITVGFEQFLDMVVQNLA